MQLNKLQLNNMKLKRCKGVPVEKQSTVKSSQRVQEFQTVTTNQQEQQVSQ